MNKQLLKLIQPDNYDISYVYKNGNIHKIIETATSNVLWEAIDIDSKGNITQSKIGNLTQNKIFDQMGRLTHKNSKRNATFVQSWDYQYDAMNNIKSRIDNVNFQRENFGYDNLNRLLEVHHGYLNQQLLGLVQSMNYDNLGNITFKTDVGNMQYSPTHPFQMEMLTENPQTITSEHVLEYFVSGRTKTIEDNDKKLQFTYGSDLQRRKMEYFLEDQLQSTTLYPFGNYEEVHNAATNDVLKYNYIGSPDGLIAIRKTTNGTSQLYYTLTDHLGSIDALCNTNGSVVERYSYDAWGNRRNPSDWTLAETRTNFVTNRGFTGHQHLDKFGLINANARMYEPLTGKFLAPDPYVQAPDYSQSFNRYTYCWNNPVKYSDPSGEYVHLVVGALIGGTINWMMHGAEFSLQGLGHFGVGALAGALGAGVGAGIGVAYTGAGTFGAGFMGTATVTSSSLGFVGGFASGFGGGFSSGFISGTGNSLIGGNTFRKSLQTGSNEGLKQGLIGGGIGGVIGGVSSFRAGNHALTGKPPHYQAELDNFQLVYQNDPMNCKNATLESIEKMQGGLRTQDDFKIMGDAFLRDNPNATLEEYFNYFGFDVKDPYASHKFVGGLMKSGHPTVINENIGGGHTLTIIKIRQWTPNSSVKVWFGDPARGIWKTNFNALYNSNFNLGSYSFILGY